MRVLSEKGRFRGRVVKVAATQNMIGKSTFWKRFWVNIFF